MIEYLGSKIENSSTAGVMAGLAIVADTRDFLLTFFPLFLKFNKNFLPYPFNEAVHLKYCIETNYNGHLLFQK